MASLRLTLVTTLLLVAIAVAGCSDKRSPPSETSSPTSSSAPSSATSTSTESGSSTPPSNASRPLLLHLSQCKSFGGSTFPIPSPLAPGTAPTGWEQEDPLVLPTSYVSYDGFECARFSLGPFERGPVRFLIERHGKAAIPAKCMEGSGQSHIGIISSFLISDAELAAFLHDQYGLATVFGEFAIEEQPFGAATQYKWTWGPSGAEPSDLTFYQEAPGQTWDFGDRFFWQRGEGIGVLQLSYDREGPSTTNRDGHGTMREPMLLASTAGGAFAGPVNFYPDHAGEGVFSLFSDLRCEEPEPSP